ncbi:endogenous retrovirus group K member 25 Env polyprotein-like [Bos indicus x Bos taurus]|uniref:endogenous retrovirus group K member 25 Env polyprotein-like n=1 Tax=Bos indicus x Bos taurus TaxID=30522 RepID=UPI000F7D259F|nr:endogenous retrovirus group K member 25 Env polyprotein-like [Bos indicus x Bos taurus]
MRKRHHLNPYQTWAQVKNMTRQAEQTLKSTGTPMTPDKLFLAMLAVLSCSSGVSAEYVYWAYIPNPPLLSIVDWVDKAPMIFTNDSTHFPSPWSTKRPIHEEDEGKPINISVGFKTLPICLGSHPLCMTIFPQWWAYSANNGTASRLGMFAMASFLLNGSERHYPGQIANYSNSLFQPEEPTCHTVSWRRKQEIQPLHWSDCQGQFGKVSIIQQNHTTHTFIFVDCGPHGLFVNCSEEQEELHNCSWFNRSNIGGFHKSKTSFWADKDILLNWYNGGLSPP